MKIYAEKYVLNPTARIYIENLCGPPHSHDLYYRSIRHPYKVQNSFVERAKRVFPSMKLLLTFMCNYFFTLSSRPDPTLVFHIYPTAAANTVVDLQVDDLQEHS